MIDALVYLSKNQQNILVIMRLEIALPHNESDLQQLLPFNKWEIDDRISLHDMDQFQLGFSRLMTVLVDTGEMVIACFAYWSLSVTELWIEFGKGKDRRWLPIHSCPEKASKSVRIAAIFWYVLTGCDSVSQFLERDKSSAWKTWKVFPEVTETLLSYPN